ncbi:MULTISPECIES: hypothetical protein [unclassified Rathayibacter]|uniref:hypothetical protein n=1 Tax=unclassified Rathayibacter TaxID=2609250 RepID=UPI00104DF538|nr:MULTISPECIES: hypothetical protein [unclassified Rathayibacter]TCL85848.1 hypothetical protein EDF49_101517 [Rathayibacter sp. PhB192]TCM31669.1 hypothetical protein EDF43_101517 [Rathayibacter sp. PhB179]
MDDEIQLIEDADGIAVIGEPSIVERFLRSEGLTSSDLRLERLRPALGAGASAAQAASAIAAGSGRWVKLTEESAAALSKHGQMMSTRTGLGLGVVQGADGRIKGIVQFATTGPGALLTNPAALSSVAGMMAQASMQKSIDEINEYLAEIDEKVDDLVRGQKDAALADMMGVDLVIEEAMTIREAAGRVSDVTWSKVQSTSLSLARTQAYALLQLDALAEKIEGTTKLGDVARITREAEPKVREWLAVLARCFQLQEASAVLELDRVLDSSADDLDRHRLGLQAARKNRLEQVAQSTERLITRMDAAVSDANAKVLLNPLSARAVVDSSNVLASGVVAFQVHLGLERLRESANARGWLAAANDIRDKMLETGAESIGAARRFGDETAGRGRAMADKLSLRLAEGALRRRAESGTDKVEEVPTSEQLD